MAKFTDGVEYCRLGTLAQDHDTHGSGGLKWTGELSMCPECCLLPVEFGLVLQWTVLEPQAVELGQEG